MWKYRCKSHLLSLIGAFFVGALITAFSMSSDMAIYQEFLPREVYQFMSQNTVMTYMIGGFSFAGIVNTILIFQLLSSTFGVSPFIMILVLMMAANVALMIGTFLVIPAVIVCIYGMVSLKLSREKEMARRNFSQDSELVRMYTLHHELIEDMKPLADTCKKNVNKMTALYLLGVVALMIVCFVVNNLLIITLIFFVYMFLFNILLKYRASCLIPITSLLYDQCNPEMCASAIIYYSTKNGKVKLKNQTLFAQCLIYLDDPELAQDVLISYPRKDAASSLTYWSLMASIYYQLKDEDGLNRCKEEATKIKLGFGQTGVMIQSEEVAAIQNKINLMNGEFSTSKKYYLDSLKKSRFAFQQVDACYYIALISFVEQDYPLSNLYFDKVVSLGNKMSFVKKAKHYQSKMENMDLSLDSYKS